MLFHIRLLTRCFSLSLAPILSVSLPVCLSFTFSTSLFLSAHLVGVLVLVSAIVHTISLSLIHSLLFALRILTMFVPSAHTDTNEDIEDKKTHTQKEKERTAYEAGQNTMTMVQNEQTNKRTNKQRM